MPHHAGQVAGSKATVKAAHLGAGLAKNSIVSGDGEVAHYVQHMATPDRIPRHQGNHHLGHRANQPLQIQHVEPGYAGFIHIAAVTPHALVAPGAKGVFAIAVGASPGEQHHANAAVFSGIGEGFVEFDNGFGAKGIALVGPIDGDFGDAIGLLVKDVVVGFNVLPVNLHRGRVQ